MRDDSSSSSSGSSLKVLLYLLLLLLLLMKLLANDPPASKASSLCQQVSDSCTMVRPLRHLTAILQRPAYSTPISSDSLNSLNIHHDYVKQAAFQIL